MDDSWSVCLNPQGKFFVRRFRRSAFLLLLLLGAGGVNTAFAQTPRLPLVSEPAATLRFREAAPVKEPPGKAYVEGTEEPKAVPAVLPALRSVVVSPIPSPQVLPQSVEANDSPSELRQPSIALKETQPWLPHAPCVAALSRPQADAQSATSPNPLAQPTKVAPVLVETPIRPQNVSRSVRPNTGRWSPTNDGIRDYPAGAALRTPERRSILSFLRGPASSSSTIQPVTAPASAEAIPMPGQRISAQAAAPGRSVVASSAQE